MSNLDPKEFKKFPKMISIQSIQLYLLIPLTLLSGFLILKDRMDLIQAHENLSADTVPENLSDQIDIKDAEIEDLNTEINKKLNELKLRLNQCTEDCQVPEELNKEITHLFVEKRACVSERDYLIWKMSLFQI